MATLTAGAGSTTWTAASFSGGAASTAADEVIVPTGATLTISAANTVLCRSFSVTGTGTIIFAATTSVMTVGDATAGTGNVAISIASGGTVTLTGVGTINLVSTSATQQTITTGGKSFGNITINGAGSSYLMSDALTSSGTVTLTTGTFDTGNYNVTSSVFSSNNSSTRTLTLGSTTWTLTGVSSSPWNTNTTSNMTFNAGTSTILATGANQNNCVFAFGNLSLYNFTKTGTAAKTNYLLIFGSLTCTGTFTVNGDSVINRVLVGSGNPATLAATPGTAATVTAATVAVTNADFMDITGAGAGSWNLSGITGNSGDCGGNSGITFTTPATQTNTGATGSWSDSTKWTSRVPLPQDDVVINTGSGTITADMPRLGKGVDFTGFTGTASFNTTTELYGSLTLASGMTLGAYTQAITLAGRSSYTVTSAGKQFSNQIQFNGYGGTYTLADAFTSTQAFTVLAGSFVSANYTMTVLTFNSTGTVTRSVTLGSSTVNITQTTASTVWNVAATGLTLSAASSTIVISTTSANTRTFAGGGLTYGKIQYTVAGSTGQFNFTGSNTFLASPEISDTSNARTIGLANATTQTLGPSADLNSVVGASGRVVNIVSLTGGSTTTFFSKPSGGPIATTTDYLAFTDVGINQPLSLFAGANSTASNAVNVYTTTPGTYRYQQGIAGPSTAGTSIAATYAAATTPGNLLIAEFTSSGSQTVFTPMTGWTQAITKTQTSLVYIYYKIADGTESTVTFSQTQSRQLNLTISEYTGFTGTATLDVTDSNGNASAGTSISTTATTGPTNTAQPALAFAYVANTSTLGTTTGITNSFNEDRTTGLADTRNKSFVKELTSLAAVETTISWSSNRSGVPIVLAVFKNVGAVANHNALLLMGVG